MGPRRARRLVATTAALLPLLGAAGRARAQAAPTWDGYLQLRYGATSAADSGVSIRRAKLWVAGDVGEPLAYRVQARFNNALSGGFMLQDAWIEYHEHGLALQAGQMAPAFSLERSQPDYAIPVVERAEAVDALIPSAETGARDVGLQLSAPLAAGHLHAWTGLFDGSGANQAAARPGGYLLTQRATASASLGGHLQAELGYSLALRHAPGLAFKRIFGDTARFTGTDFRWGLDARLAHPHWALQGEFLQARLGGRAAWGYYALGDYDVTCRDQLVALFDRYRDLAPVPEERPWLGAGWNHRFAGDRVKLMTAARARFDPGATAWAAVTQFQLMFR